MNKQIEEIYQQVIDEDCANPLYRFAELVRADEREACAKLVEEVGRQTAKAIRGRGAE